MPEPTDTEMPAETIRRAATLMHDEATFVTADGDLDEWYEADEILDILARAREPKNSRTEADARHIAAWHPLVALNVAALLDAVVRDLARSERYLGAHEMTGSQRAVLAVAREYLAAPRAERPYCGFDMGEGDHCLLPAGHDGQHS